MGPLNEEVPQTDWPTIQIGEHQMVMKWGLRLRWLCSKRGVNLSFKSDDPRSMDITLEWFAASVSGHFTSRGQQAPTAEFWVGELEKLGPVGAMAKLEEITEKILDAFLKARAAETAPLPADPAVTGATSQTLN